MSMTHMTDSINSWLPLMEYYMEDVNIPSDRKERERYYQEARSYLTSRLLDLCVMVRAQARLEMSDTAAM